MFVQCCYLTCNSFFQHAYMYLALSVISEQPDENGDALGMHKTNLAIGLEVVQEERNEEFGYHLGQADS